MIVISERERHLLGLRIHAISIVELLNLIESIINLKKSIIVYGFSANIFSRLRNTPEFIHFFEKMDVVVSDGQGIPLLARMFQVDIHERVGIVNLTNRLLILANENKLKILLLGATEEINNAACANIIKNYPEIKDCKGINGYFKSNEELRIVNFIAEYQPDILFIGISSPIKEYFALKYKNTLNAKIIIPCGGWIDVMAGKYKRPPFLLKRIPITWFFRFIQEPKRMFAPIILTMIDTIFLIIPILYLKHILRIERNPSIIKYLKLEKKIAEYSI